MQPWHYQYHLCFLIRRRGSALATFPVAMIKYSNRSNLIGKSFLGSQSQVEIHCCGGVKMAGSWDSWSRHIHSREQHPCILCSAPSSSVRPGPSPCSPIKKIPHQPPASQPNPDSSSPRLPSRAMNVLSRQIKVALIHGIPKGIFFNQNTHVNIDLNPRLHPSTTKALQVVTVSTASS